MTNEEKRVQRRINELGDRKPKCSVCGEGEISTLRKVKSSLLEEHHIAGGHAGETSIVCRNCHAKLTDKQQDWPKGIFAKDRSLEIEAVGFIYGLADFLEYLAQLCRRFAAILYEFVTNNQGGLPA